MRYLIQVCGTTLAGRVWQRAGGEGARCTHVASSRFEESKFHGRPRMERRKRSNCSVFERPLPTAEGKASDVSQLLFSPLLAERQLVPLSPTHCGRFSSISEISPCSVCTYYDQVLKVRKWFCLFWGCFVWFLFGLVFGGLLFFLFVCFLATNVVS